MESLAGLACIPIAMVQASLFEWAFHRYWLHRPWHDPGIAWIERSRYFRFLERHHRIHHVRMRRNLNVLPPIGDFLLGTLVIESPKRAVTSDRAREQPLRQAPARGQPTSRRRGM